MALTCKMFHEQRSILSLAKFLRSEKWRIEDGYYACQRGSSTKEKGIKLRLIASKTKELYY